MNRSIIKENAKKFAFNNKWNIWKPFLIMYAIVYGITFLLAFFLRLDPEGNIYTLVDLGLSIATMPLTVGVMYYLINLVRGKKVDVFKDLFSKYNIFVLILLTTLYIGAMTFVWLLLLIIPGIIYSYKVIMVPFLLADEDINSKSATELVELSKKMMDGYKMDYFIFQLSFIGWILLCFVTCGIACIWVIPYIEVASVMYYEELKKNRLK